jgi:hypothetical protein
LRGYDAAHLACALQLAGGDILLATRDNALNAPALTSPLEVANRVARESNRAAQPA